MLFGFIFGLFATVEGFESQGTAEGLMEMCSFDVEDVFLDCISDLPNELPPTEAHGQIGSYETYELSAPETQYMLNIDCLLNQTTKLEVSRAVAKRISGRIFEDPAVADFGNALGMSEIEASFHLQQKISKKILFFRDQLVAEFKNRDFTVQYHAGRPMVMGSRLGRLLKASTRAFLEVTFYSTIIEEAALVIDQLRCEDDAKPKGTEKAALVFAAIGVIAGMVMAGMTLLCHSLLMSKGR